jgi:hypothetical protein
MKKEQKEGRNEEGFKRRKTDENESGIKEERK